MAAIDVEPSRRMPDEIVGRCGPENSPLSRADLVSTGLPQRIRANTIPKSSSRPESRARSRFSSGECLHLQAIQPIATLQRPRRSIGEWNTNRARRCAQKVIFDDGPTRSRTHARRSRSPGPVDVADRSRIRARSRVRGWIRTLPSTTPSEWSIGWRRGPVGG